MAKASQPRRDRRATVKLIAELAPELLFTDAERAQLSETVLKQTLANKNMQEAQGLYARQCEELRVNHEAWLKRVSDRLKVDPAVLVAHYVFNPDDTRVVLKPPPQEPHEQ